VRINSLSDFLVTGTGVFPVVMLIAGRPALAILLFCPLLIAACLTGLYEQAMSAEARDRDRRHDKRGAPENRHASGRDCGRKRTLAA